MFDVIIVGAGPAGSSCARRVAELGLSTLVLERTAFPRSKPCGSGLSARALAHLGAEVEPILHDSVDTIRVDLGPRAGLRWQGAARVLATTTRREIDSLLAGLAEAAGADAARSGDLPADAYRSRLVREVLPHVNVIRVAGNLCYSAGPRALAFVVRAPALRSVLMRVGPWGRLGPGGGRLVVETP